MVDDTLIRERLAKIAGLFSGATSAGERQAAQAAMERIQQRISGQAAIPPPSKATAERLIEYRFSLTNPWSLRLFLALCRSKGYKPYRYPRMRRTSVCVRISARAVDTDLWPEYQQMNKVLSEYLSETADRIIADCINPDRSDAETVIGLPGPLNPPDQTSGMKDNSEREG